MSINSLSLVEELRQNVNNNINSLGGNRERVFYNQEPRGQLVLVHLNLHQLVHGDLHHDQFAHRSQGGHQHEVSDCHSWPSGQSHDRYREGGSFNIHTVPCRHQGAGRSGHRYHRQYCPPRSTRGWRRDRGLCPFPLLCGDHAHYRPCWNHQDDHAEKS